MAQIKVGKHVGSSHYLHKSAVEWFSPAGADLLQAALVHLPADFQYDYVKFDRATSYITFSGAPGFDQDDEPVVTDQFLVRPDGTTLFIKAPSDPFILHGKHLFVIPEYQGFDWEASRRRFETYQQWLWLDKTRMGRLSWWQKNVMERGLLDGL